MKYATELKASEILFTFSQIIHEEKKQNKTKTKGITTVAEDM